MNEPTEKQRTLQQNKSLHKLFALISEALNESGFEYHKVIPEMEIPMTPTLVKEGLWRPIQMAMLNKASTTELTTKEIDQVFDVLNKHLSKQGLHVAFPSIEEMMMKDYEPNQ